MAIFTYKFPILYPLIYLRRLSHSHQQIPIEASHHLLRIISAVLFLEPSIFLDKTLILFVKASAIHYFANAITLIFYYEQQPLTWKHTNGRLLIPNKACLHPSLTLRLLLPLEGK